MIKNKKALTRILALFLAVVTIAACLSISGCTKSSPTVKILDSTGKEIATVTSNHPFEAELENSALSAYVQTAIENAVELIMSDRNCEEKKAEKILFNGCSIKTSFDKNAFSACDKAYKSSSINGNAFAFALTDLHGNLICAYSSEKETNYALNKTQPYSSIKPLSVYAPAIEKNIINYSSMFVDEPIKKVMSQSGEYEDWPQNPQKKYANENVSVADGIKHSLNTTAIHCLNALGVRNSIDFLVNNFSIDLDHEIQIMNSTSEDEILSAIGLGYFESGVSPVDMAGYYQIFANEGIYTKPSAVAEIADKHGKVIFSTKKEQKQVISSDTAYIMNRLLQNTLSDGGTAEKAYCRNLQVGGKTGTGDQSKDNWFVGFTPQYSFSIWHAGTSSMQNQCAAIFHQIAQEMDFGEGKVFAANENVCESAYCTKTGKLLDADCNEMELGYFKKNALPDSCSGNHSF